ncbi:hypothetical protein [Leptospira sp. 'Mane']|uniref:Lsa25.6 family adhesin n=1 Tax=Leptospira sp. 'Mane' TaxID=3387407 RepID=UPI00398A7845
MLRICLLTTVFLFLFQCKGTTLPLPFGTEMRIMPVDTAGTGKIDTNGYYLPEKDNYRVVYLEIDKNTDGSSDEFIWQGHSTVQEPGSPLRKMVKVHEEVDENYDGKVDLLRWMLPNEKIVMVQKDSDKDGFFETTQYYNFNNKVVRRELDTNKDGYADIFIFSDRAEVDSDGDRVPDLYVIGSSDLELEEKATNRRDTKPLKKDDSYLFNQKLLPMTERSIIGSGLL